MRTQGQYDSCDVKCDCELLCSNLVALLHMELFLIKLHKRGNIYIFARDKMELNMILICDFFPFSPGTSWTETLSPNLIHVSCFFLR